MSRRDQAGILTEADLRVRNGTPRLNKVIVAKGTFITPLAREYLDDHRIELCIAETAAEFNAYGNDEGVLIFDQKSKPKPMPSSAVSGAEKPEDMTHLNGTQLVHKSHRRIHFRGQLDLLQAEIVLAQTTAMAANKTKVLSLLDEVLQFVRRLLAAEVKGAAAEDQRLFGIELEAFRALSHRIFRAVSLEAVTPHASQGRVAAEVNALRARVRSCELAAVEAFPQDERRDLIRQLNRLSSAMFVLYYWIISGLPEEMWHD